ncbi:hypothetical protein MQX03_12350 [Chryseobacterium aahli]|uniref:hypothetical protein n=1 Tax=Chryseobacterium aahli TaxID=1278643 RepID=UPI001F6169C8|nr:hypothetical protein [Chryseobacterium aahli]MCI3937994.1 hypothetical protein [Chryseobacterium aahli]
MIKFNKDYFESRVRIAERLFEENLYEDCINYMEKTAFFGWHNFSGYYKSEKLEILLSKIQEKVLPEISIKKSEKKSNTILHIASELYTEGGHSKLLYTWIKNDQSKKHSILCTRQSVKEIEDVTAYYLKNSSDLDHLSVHASSKIESAKLLQNEVQKDYDIIMLHVHPDETIPSIVFSQKSIATPVCLVNHADHTFWLGTSIADLVLQIRESNIVLDSQRRGIPVERQVFLPIPIENLLTENNDATKKNDQILQLLSTGTPYKYNPNSSYNFLKEAYRIVEENPNVIFNVVGIDQESDYGKEYRHERLVLHGIIPAQALAEIEKNTAIYVEGFPMASFTALLQAALQNIPFALHYNPLPLFKLFSDRIDDGIVYPDNLEEWHQNVKNLIRDQQYRNNIGKRQHQYILNNFSIKVWKSRVKEIYLLTEKVNHSFHPPSKDTYYDGDNEKLLAALDNRTLPHFSFTQKLSLGGKYFVYQMSKHKNPYALYLNPTKVFKYFIFKK